MQLERQAIKPMAARDFGPGIAKMPARLVALDEGPDIVLDRAMVVVGRHPQCDARLDSLRISRHHCCMTQDQNEVVVRDLGSTNGIRINGQRVEVGRLRAGDELSIAHIRYRLDSGQPAQEKTLADPRLDEPVSLPVVMAAVDAPPRDAGALVAAGAGAEPDAAPEANENPLAAAVRRALPSGVAEHCRIQVIVQLPPDASAVENLDACRPDSSP
jgi:pSer/pThr/pTyr-binding forkhead associated (FHA) protein